MEEQTPNTTPDMEEPFIPPWIMLVLAAVGLVIFFIVLFTQAEFTLIGWGGLGLMVLSLVAWVLMAPEQAGRFFSGRTFRFGGTALLVTVILLVAMVALYTLIRARSWRFDLTQTDQYTLTDAARDAITTYGADPTSPSIKIVAFYGLGQAGRRDRDTVLFDDYVTSSANKISYEFLDPDRNPLVLDEYTKPDGTKPGTGQLVVAKVGEGGALDIANSEIVDVITQEEITNAILRVSSSGDFRAYFLDVKDGLKLDDDGGSGLSALNNVLKDRLNWKTTQATLFGFSSPEAEFKLTDTADGIVLVIPGGTEPLPDDQLKQITDYVDKGGDLIVLADLSQEGDSLATAPNFSTYLFDHFGLRVNNDVVLDLASSGGNAFMPLVTDFPLQNPISATLAQFGGAMLFPVTHTIEVNSTTPENVNAMAIARTSSASFAKTDIDALVRGDTNKGEDDKTGPLIVAAAAENTETGARVVVFGSTGIATNDMAQLSGSTINNLTAMWISMIWTTKYDEFAGEIPRVEDLQDTVPLLASPSELSNINLVTIILVPLGMLAIGVFVWWSNRERETTRP